MDMKLDGHEKINYVKNKMSSAHFAINQVKYVLPLKALKTLFYSLLFPHMD